LKRNLEIDYLRSGVTILVVIHHAALAYTTFSHYDSVQYLRSTAPVVDTLRFMPLDLLVHFNDMFFMPLMFLISGLFVIPALERKGCGRFLSDRAKRLGIPFIISAVVLSPLAFYPSWLLSDPVSRGDFLPGFFNNSNWTPGPAWFIWLLLAFSGVVAVAYRLMPNLMKKLSLAALSARSLVGIVLDNRSPVLVHSARGMDPIVGSVRFSDREALPIFWLVSAWRCARRRKLRTVFITR